MKAFGPHRGSEYALHLPGTAFGLLGVLLKGPLGDRHRLPPPRTVPHPVSNCLQIDLRESFGTATLPTGTSVPTPRGEGVFWPLFGTATPPTGISVPSRRGEDGLLSPLVHEMSLSHGRRGPDRSSSMK